MVDICRLGRLPDLVLKHWNYFGDALILRPPPCECGAGNKTMALAW